jgi:NADH-quinone oxidoreductase subunit L
MFVGWEGVGLCSYLLIGFWYEKPSAAEAGKKAFIVNRIGDWGVLMGMFALFGAAGSLNYQQAFAAAPHVFAAGGAAVTLLTLFLFLGATGKSAQIPLFTWLPDAMEGPTPVSALIHAATMVTAGVYLIARMHPLFELAPIAADVGAVIGCLTLLIAATIGLVVTDLKRVIAYSTMSQIGYMIMAASSAAYAAGMFHLMTHAFFKALLFMAAGSIIAAMANEQNIDKMRGFGKAMRFTAITMLCGGLALAAFPGTSGFFSKDEILAYATARGGMYLIFTVLGYFGALLTAIYTFRLIFRVLPGKPCPEAQELIDTGHVHHAHPFNPATGEEEDTEVGFPGAEHHIAERSASMRIAMAVLAFGALFAGLVQVPGVDHVVGSFLDPVFEGLVLSHVHPSVGAEWFGLAIGAAISLAGIGIAYYLYVARPETPAALQRRFSALHTFLYNKWYFDEAIDFLVVRPALAIGRFANRTFERVVVDGLISGTEDVVGAGGRLVRLAQSGFVRSYALLLIAGFAGLALYFLLSAS